MTTRSALAALATAGLLAFALAGCAPAADTPTDPGTDTGTDDTTTTETDDGGFSGVTLPGTGEYSIPDQAPIGGFELPDADSQPDGCTWHLYTENGDLVTENEGTFAFLTDVTARFVTDGCPDWVQFE